MPAELIPALGSLAMLLNPPPPLFISPSETRHEQPAEEIQAAHLFGDWGGIRTDLSRHGFGFTIQYIGEMQANVSGGLKHGTVYTGLLNVMLDLDLEKLSDWKGTSLHAAMLFPHGHGLSADHTGDLFVLSNLDASSDPRLFEIWFQQTFASEKFSVRAGQIAVDQEFAFTEQGALFNNSALGWIPIGGANIPAPIYPQGAVGLRLAWHPADFCYAQVGLFDGDPNPHDSQGRATNPNGIDFRFDEGALIIGETGCTWKLTGHQLAGLAKLGGWYHTRSFDHLRLDAGGRSLADPASTEIPRRLHGNWGAYFVAEQRFWSEPSEKKDSGQGLGFFARLGVAPPDRNALQFYAEGGLVYQGLIPGRDDDKLGLAVAYGQRSAELRALAQDENSLYGTSQALPDHELVVELAYRASIRTVWSLQPGLQYISHPGGSAAIHDAVVLGLRTQFDF